MACGGGRAVSRTLDDARITAQVKTVLLNDTEVDATKIDVRTSDGVVTMTGDVRSRAEEDRIVQLARQVTGVKDVRAKVEVRSLKSEG
jgi:hyperosmotically inducible protein